jgi:hypothetical protein
MPTITLLTTQREVTLEAPDVETAREIFMRRQSPPEPFPCPAGTRYDWELVGPYFERWPVLAWQHGECIYPGGLLDGVRVR